MSAIAAAVKHMLAAGVPHEAIVAAVAEMEAAIPRAETPEERRRRVSRESSQRYRERGRGDGNTSPNVTERHASPVTDGDRNASQVTETRHPASPPRARGEDITSTSVDTCSAAAEETREPVAGDWPDDPIRALVAAVSSPYLDPTKSPGLITTSGRLAQWRRQGASWTHDVLPVVLGLCAKVRRPISYWSYFDNAIGEAIAANRRALTIPEAPSHANPTVVPISPKLAAKRANMERALAGAESAARARAQHG